MESRIGDRFNLLLIGLIFCAGGCISEIELDLKGENRVLVINGHITNRPESYFVSVKFTGNSSIDHAVQEPVSNAKVWIQSSTGQTAFLTEDSLGVYKTDPEYFIGKIGEHYQLFVEEPELGRYNSGIEPLLPVYPIVDLDYQYFETPELNELNNIAPHKSIDIFATTVIPTDPENTFIKWTVTGEYEFREIEALTDIFATTGVGPAQFTCFIQDIIRLGDVVVFDASKTTGDLFIREKIKSIDINYKFAFNYCVHVKQFSLSKTAYRYWNQVKMVRERTGDFFEGIPGQVIGNIRSDDHPEEVVHGLFYASAVASDRIFVERDSVSRPISPCIIVDSSFDEPCKDCLLLRTSTKLRPSYWPN